MTEKETPLPDIENIISHWVTTSDADFKTMETLYRIVDGTYKGASKMDTTEAVKIARRFASEIMTLYDCKRVFLFGSHAKGTGHEESDIDIAVILKDYDNLMDIQLELMKLRRKIDSRIEPHPFRERDFHAADPIVNEILKYGRRIDALGGDKGPPKNLVSSTLSTREKPVRSCVNGLMKPLR